jgi:membrane protease YdiL (CAAX protease family)
MLFGIALFIPMFVIQVIGPFDFWWWMSVNLFILILLSLVVDRNYLPFLRQDMLSKPVGKVLIALASVVVLYFLFYTGNYLSRLWFSFAGDQIGGIYLFKGDASPARVILLMALIIGPGEELFWRGFVQRHLSSRMGRLTGFLVATALYSLVHVATGNFILVMAALVCGLFWGWLFYKYNSMLVNIVSHTVWDIAVFVVFPFQ